MTDVASGEIALAALGEGWQAPPGSTIYSSLEPCSARASRPRTCTDLILAAHIGRVVFAWREPSIFVEGRGAELLRNFLVEVCGCDTSWTPESFIDVAVREIR